MKLKQTCRKYDYSHIFNKIGSIRNKLAFMMLVALLPGTLGGAFLALNFFDEHYTQDIAIKEQASLHTVKNYLEYMVHTASQDIELLSDIESVKDSTNSVLISNQNYKNHELEKIFTHFLHTRNLYDQIRLLNSKGWEICRVNLKDGKTVAVPADKLQNKSTRYYFKEAIKLTSEQIYISPIDLNREKGQIERPLKPMLRLAKPVFSRNKNLLGVLALNFYAQNMLEAATKRSDFHPTQGFWIISDQDGFYLSNPDSSKNWGRKADLATGHNLAKDWPDKFKKILQGQTVQISNKGKRFKLVSVKANLWPDNSRFLILSHAIPEHVWQVHLREVSIYILLPLSLISIIAGIIAWILGRTITRRIAMLSNAVQNFSNGDFKARTTETKSRDEVEVLSREFNSMAASLQSFYSDLENKFNKNERRIAATFEQAAVGICHVSMAGRFLEANQTLCKMWGYTKEKLLSMTVSQTTWDSDLQQTSKRFDKLLSGKANSISAEKLYKTADGHPWWGQLTSSAVRDDKGRIEYFISVIEDINERKKNDEELYKLSLIATRTDNLVAITDINGRLTWVNNAFIHKTGYKIEEVIGRKPGNLLQGPGTDPETVKYMAECLARQQGFNTEILNYDKNKNPYWVQLSVQPLVNESGDVTGYMAINQDITDRKQYEEMLIQARNEAEQASLAKSDFLARMSHEIRTPMNGVIGMTYLLLQNYLNPKQREFANKIKKSAEALLHIINDILDFSKIEAGKIELEHIPFSLESLMQELIEMTIFSAEEKNLKMTVSIEDAIPDELIGDPLRLRQILLNLISNAIKFTEQGEIIISARLQSKYEYEDEVELVIAVTDTGIGIPEDVQDTLFDSFTQADGSTSRKYGGTGLGLAICKHLVELMQGRLQVQSSPGKGSSFYFNAFWKISKAGQRSQPDTKKPEKLEIEDRLGHVQGARILVVEDNEVNRQVITGLLEQAGLLVEHAFDGQKALNILQNKGHGIDLVLMDIEMPGMDGYETCRRLRKRKFLSELPILSMTAHARAEDREKSLEAGMNGHLVKPIDPEAVYQAIANWVPARKKIPGPSFGSKNKEQEIRLPDSIAGINIQDGLHKIGGDPGSYQKALLRFASSQKKTARLLRMETDPKKLKEAVHTLKGVAGNIGAQELTACCLQVEQELSTQKSGQEQINKLADCIDLTIKAIQSSMVEPEKTASPSDETGQCAKLEKIPDLIESDISQAFELWEQIQSDVQHHFPTEAKKLDKALQNFNMDTTQKIVNHIMSQISKSQLKEKSYE